MLGDSLISHHNMNYSQFTGARCAYWPWLRQHFPATGTLSIVSNSIKGPDAVKRDRALGRVDRELSKGNFKTALTLVKQLQGKPGGLRGFGAAKQVPRRISSLEELKLSGVDISPIQSLVDPVLDSITCRIQFQSSNEVSLSGLEGLMPVELNDSPSKDCLMCIQHEAGHFLVGYLLGVLPKGYVVPCLEAQRQENFSGGKVKFFSFEFLGEVDAAFMSEKKFTEAKLCDGVNGGKISSTNLSRFLCATLGGLTAEHLLFGYCKGSHSDVETMGRVFQWMGFTENEASYQLKWAVLNTLSILARHQEAVSRLAEAMALGRSVGSCIKTIEDALNTNEI